MPFHTWNVSSINTDHWGMLKIYGLAALGESQEIGATCIGSTGRPYCGTKAPGFPEDYVFGNAQYPVTGLTSRYQALQLQFQRRTSHGLQIFAAYSWAHSVDDAPIYRGSAAAYSLIRGDSDVDRRHVLRVGATYSQPRITGMRLACRLFNGWSTALNTAVQSGTPFSI